MRPRGRFVVAIAYAVAAAPAAAQVPAGGDLQLNTYTTGRQYSFSRYVAMDADGDFVAVWSSGHDGSGFGVFGQRFARSGSPVGAEFQVNTYTTGFQGVPGVAIDARGGFVVVWEGQPTSGLGEIRAQRFDAAGNRLGGEVPVNEHTAYYTHRRPHVSRSPDGRFVVSWTNQNDGSVTGIAARLFDAAGAPVGGEFTVNTYTTGGQTFGGAAMDAAGNFFVVWHEGYGLGMDGIRGQRFDALGNRVGSEIQVNTYTPGVQHWASVSGAPDGTFVVVWESSHGEGSGYNGYGIFARRIDPAGNPVGNDFVVNAYTTGNQHFGWGNVAHDARGNFVVSWSSADGSGYGVYAQRFLASGARRGAEFRVNAATAGHQTKPSVASDEVGNFVVAWHGPGYPTEDLVARRFGGLGPAALDIDRGANRVWEPGESVSVHPSWRNQNGAAQTFAATLAGIAGPAGASYAITDGIGDYGTVANGVSAECLDCYAVSVSNPAVRPAVHWDASAVEGLIPDSQGQEKVWRLHIGRSFADVTPSSPFYRFVETLLHNEVTTGCSGATYCPIAATTREQMAVFVLVAKEGAGYLPPACGTAPLFLDVPTSSPFCGFIEELARRGVVSGCGAGNYCPTAEVTREQISVFALRTLDGTLNPPACGAPMFSDVPASNPFCRWIEELARRGVIAGCGAGNYCPLAQVTREQMGVFISATFQLTLYGP